MSFIKSLCFFMLFCTILACNNSSSSSSDIAPVVETTPPPPPVPVNNYPTLPQDLIQRLLTECDYIDYVFYDLGFSVNINDKKNVGTALQQIGTSGPQYLNCPKSMGRVSFLAQGEVITEAEIHYTEGYCTYFVFYDNKQPTYATLITETGLTFLGNLAKRTQGQ